jgi:hypothetical protein
MNAIVTGKAVRQVILVLVDPLDQIRSPAFAGMTISAKQTMFGFAVLYPTFHCIIPTGIAMVAVPSMPVVSVPSVL